MHPRLEYLFESIEMQRQTLLLSLRALDYETLNNHPEGKWSIIQIIAHLISAERLSVNYITKKIQSVESVANTGFVEELKMLLLKISQRLPMKFKAPKVVIENTTKENNLGKLEEEWNGVRDDLKKILEQVEDHHVKRKIYRHVRVGMINIQHALQFFREHVIHHKPQIKNLLKRK